MTTIQKRTIAHQLNAAQVAISNTLAEAEIQTLVGAYGYDANRVGEGRTLYESAMRAVEAQRAAVGAQHAASDRFEAAFIQAEAAYQDLAKVARAIYMREPARLSSLGLIGVMAPGTAAFIKQAYTLFDNALNLAQLREELKAFGYDEARLLAEKAKIVALDQSNQAQEAAKGTAQQATQERDTALAALHEWLARYLKVAKVALKGKRQLLEKLEVPARTTLTAAQAAARRARRSRDSQPSDQPPSATPPAQA